MSSPRLHFSFEQKSDSDLVALDRKQMRNYKLVQDCAWTMMDGRPNIPFEEADIVVTVGGDGSLLHAFRHAVSGKRVFGVVPSNNSHGFWAHHGIQTRKKLDDALAMARSYPLYPVRGDVVSVDGRQQFVRGFNELSILTRGGEDADGDALLLNVSIETPMTTIGPRRIMGDGIFMSTPFGTTGWNKSHYGPIMGIRSKDFVLTGGGIYSPEGGFNSHVINEDECVRIDFLSGTKRPFRILRDARRSMLDRTSPFKYMRVRREMEHYVNLMLTHDPATHTYNTFRAQGKRL